MAKKGNEGQTARTFDAGDTSKRLNQNQKRKQQQKEKQTAKNFVGENLSREKAWQTSGRIPFAECKEIRGPEPESSQRSSSHPTTTGDFSQKQAQAATITSAASEGKSKTSAETKNDGVTQRVARVERKATTSRGRTRSQSRERGARGRSPSGGSYTTARSMGVMIPRHCTATRRRRPLSKDPVALYHYYQSEWNYFRDQIPGENSHAELRWMIRERLLDPN
ncbi:uncharacterized protein LOC101449684 [Ceratitis capitata]|nr:uncharacterized protein LOC101449684 [Ceratitis capitata]